MCSISLGFLPFSLSRKKNEQPQCPVGNNWHTNHYPRIWFEHIDTLPLSDKQPCIVEPVSCSGKHTETCDSEWSRNILGRCFFFSFLIKFLYSIVNTTACYCPIIKQRQYLLFPCVLYKNGAMKINLPCPTLHYSNCCKQKNIPQLSFSCHPFYNAGHLECKGANIKHGLLSCF